MMRWGQRSSSVESAMATVFGLAILLAVGIGVALVIFGGRTEP